MGYFINGRKRSDGTEAWGLVFRTEADGKRTTKRIRPNDLRQYGLLPSMPIGEARARVKQLNLETRHLASAEASKLRSLEQATLTRQMGKRLFPEQLVTEFERERLQPKFQFGGSSPEAKYKKALCRWRFCLKMLQAVDKVPSEWAREPRVFYAYFQKQRITAGYAVKCLVILNMWGMFISEKQGKPFLPVPAPRGYDRQSLEDKADEKEGVAHESLPLTPAILAKAKPKLSDEYFRWLYVSFWFGLRPSEVEGQWKLAYRTNQEGKQVRVLEVYQSKLAGLSKEKRWKAIPLLFPEQEKALAMLEEGKLKRPYAKLIRESLGEGFGVYAGRKGFLDLMMSKGKQIVTVSRWLGHTDIGQTMRAYKNRERVETD
jgi:hypothetical protein